MKLRIVTQLDAVERGGIYDDCAPSTLMAAANFLTGSTYTSKDGVAFLAKVGRKDVEGKPDPTTLAQLVKAAPLVGLKPRYPKSWDEIVAALKAGAFVGINVQQPVGYPASVKMSAWHTKWKSYWGKKMPAKLKTGYGHMTGCAALDGGFQWADPTMSGKGSETYAVPVTLADLKKIAESKGVGPFKRCIIFTAIPKKSSVPAPTVDLRSQIVPVNSSALVATTQVAQITSKQKVETPKVDTAAALHVATEIVGRLDKVAKGDKTMKEQIIAASLDALQAALSTAIAVFLGLGVSIFDLTGDGLKAVVASAISAGLLVLQRWLDEDNVKYGRTK